LDISCHDTPANISDHDIFGYGRLDVLEEARKGAAVQLKRAERRYNLTTADYTQLAAFRHALRAFLRFSEAAAEAVGLTAQHYQAMLVLRGCPDGERFTINDLARQLFIKHNSAVGLVDRLQREGLIAREPSSVDRRKVELNLTARGRQVLAKLAAMHRRELQRIGPQIERFFAELGQAAPVMARASRAPAKALRMRSTARARLG
jgi:DNA-binding MarR family transcriptional regulator